MRFGLLQMALGVALMAAGPVYGNFAWALAWPGVSVFYVGCGYLGLGPAVFGKDAQLGRLTTWRLLLVLPYLVVAWTLWQLKGRLLGERPHDEVAPGILVGRRPISARELPADARLVVDLTSEFPRSAWTAKVDRYVCVPTLDTAAPTEAELRALVDELAEEAGPIFVHCAMGHGRSATFAAALIIRRGLAADVDDAIALMKRARPGVHLHAVQRSAVARLAASSNRALPETP
ncbi:MAG: dual specificity protein phosphatase family protein [Sandaracinaceae bacterium]